MRDYNSQLEARISELYQILAVNDDSSSSDEFDLLESYSRQNSFLQANSLFGSDDEKDPSQVYLTRLVVPVL